MMFIFPDPMFDKANSTRLAVSWRRRCGLGLEHIGNEVPDVFMPHNAVVRKLI